MVHTFKAPNVVADVTELILINKRYFIDNYFLDSCTPKFERLRGRKYYLY